MSFLVGVEHHLQGLKMIVIHRLLLCLRGTCSTRAPVQTAKVLREFQPQQFASRGKLSVLKRVCFLVRK